MVSTAPYGSVRINGAIVEAVDVFVGGKSGPNARPGTKVLEDVPCDELPHVLERVMPYLTGSGRPSKAQGSGLMAQTGISPEP